MHCRLRRAPALLAISLTVALLAGCGGSSSPSTSSGAGHTAAALGASGAASHTSTTPGASKSAAKGAKSNGASGGTGKLALKKARLALHIQHLKLDPHLKTKLKLNLSDNLKLKLHLKLKLGKLHLGSTGVSSIP